MSDVERPGHGARFAFELLASEGARARYRVRVIDAAAEAEAEATVTPDAVELGGFEPAIDAWSRKSALAFLEVVQRGWDEEAGWPRRLQRWRQHDPRR
jgi:hypothetical protein